MNPLQLILPVIITTVLAGVIWSLSILGFVNGIGPFLGADPTLEWRDVLNQIVNSVAIVFVWSILYFSLHFIEIGQRSRIEKYKMEAEAKSAQLTVLKSQLNPHFMFNALNNIRALMLEDVPRSREMITHLSDILRYSMTYAKKQEVPMSEEIEIVKQFLSLCEIQFEDRLKYQIEASENSLQALVPPMTLQLLTENAVKHGIATLPQGGEVIVKSELNNQLLELSVSNHGALNTTDAPKKRENNGIGLENIAKRLQILHGTNATFSISEIEDRVVAKITIKQTS
ncbi:MAG: histidine kinase [Flavobacteriales bacterium]|nr:histidine kinase [Flavobacteriales bacterium]